MLQKLSFSWDYNSIITYLDNIPDQFCFGKIHNLYFSYALSDYEANESFNSRDFFFSLIN